MSRVLYSFADRCFGDVRWFRARKSLGDERVQSLARQFTREIKRLPEGKVLNGRMPTRHDARRVDRLIPRELRPLVFYTPDSRWETGT